jgi:hypothetical protein
LQAVLCLFHQNSKTALQAVLSEKTICGDFKPGRFTENSESADYDGGKNINRDCLKLTVFFKTACKADKYRI